MTSPSLRRFPAKTLFLARSIQRSFWNTADLQRHIRRCFVPVPRGNWVAELAQELMAVFPPNQPRPLLVVLCRFLRASNAWLGYIAQQRSSQKRAKCREPHQLPTARMIPAQGAPSVWQVPCLATPGQLSEWLGLTPVELDWFADCTGRLCRDAEGPKQHYRYRWIAKRSGGWRLLEAPKLRLRQIQRQVLENILDEIPPHSAAHAYRRGRSLASYLAPHAGRDIVIHIDLCHFFTSVHWPPINALFRTAGYPEEVARLLTGLCLNITPREVLRSANSGDVKIDSAQVASLRHMHLPQGAPTSPALANLAAYRLDCRLHGLAQKMELQYTRYADDLVFSGDANMLRDLGSFLLLVQRIALNEGFSVHGRKTRVMTAATRQQVSGITLNEHPNLPREAYDELRATLFNCVRFGPTSQNRNGHLHFRDHLRGKIAFWTLINPQRGAKLRVLFDRINWTSPN